MRLTLVYMKRPIPKRIRGRFMIRRVIQMGLVIRPNMAMPKVIRDARPQPRCPNCSVSFDEMYLKLKKFLDY